MSDKTKTPPDPATAPGGPAFDVDNATPEDFDKHAEILRRRALVAGLTPAAAPTLAASPGGYTPAADDFEAVHTITHERRYFTPLTWAAMETKGEHAGWEQAVPEPPKDPQ